MPVIDNIFSMETLIGMTILSRATGNMLGKVDDLIVDPVKGTLVGLMVQAPDGSSRVLDYHEISSFGQDAVMAHSDSSVVLPEEGQSVGQPRAKSDLVEAKIITEGGKLLGQVANVFIHLAPPPLAIYEVRESVLDKLLGRGLFILASLGRALSDDAERIIVPNETPEKSADSLETLATREIAPLVEEETLVREHNGDVDLPYTPTA